MILNSIFFFCAWIYNYLSQPLIWCFSRARRQRRREIWEGLNQGQSMRASGICRCCLRGAERTHVSNNRLQQPGEGRKGGARVARVHTHFRLLPLISGVPATLSPHPTSFPPSSLPTFTSTFTCPVGQFDAGERKEDVGG